jgi:hypothetical protein
MCETYIDSSAVELCGILCVYAHVIGLGCLCLVFLLCYVHGL